MANWTAKDRERTGHHGGGLEHSNSRHGRVLHSDDDRADGSRLALTTTRRGGYRDESEEKKVT